MTAPTKPKKTAKRRKVVCRCIDLMSDALEPHKLNIVWPLTGNSTAMCAVAVIAAKPRQKPPLVVASYCPFCGVKYE